MNNSGSRVESNPPLLALSPGKQCCILEHGGFWGEAMIGSIVAVKPDFRHLPASANVGSAPRKATKHEE